MNRAATVRSVVERIEARSQQTRANYLVAIQEMADASDSDRGQVDAQTLRTLLLVLWRINRPC